MGLIKTDSKGERLFWGAGTYKDRTFCESADKCAVKDCERRLTDEDKQLIRDGHYMVSMMDKCERYAEK